MENRENVKEITLSYLFGVFKKSVIFMIIAAVVFGAIGMAYSMFLEKPKYKATVSFWVTNNNASQDFAQSALTTAGVTIASSCVELASKPEPIKLAIENGDLKSILGCESDDECIKLIQSMIKAYKEEEDSLMFYIDVESKSAEKTAAVANSIKNVMPGVLDRLCNKTSDGGENKASMISSVGTSEFNADNVIVLKNSPIKVGIILGFVAAIIVYCVFFVRNIFDNSIYGESTVKENFEYPIVGHIPSFSEADESENGRKLKKLKHAANITTRNYDNKLLGNGSPFYMVESFNTLRTNIIYSATAAKNPIFAVTSDIAAAGKTVVAANLAIALSNLDKKVLLVECDMRCPAFSKLFREKRESGLSELLAGMEEKTSDLVYNYNESSLDVLFCGKIPPNPSELLSGYRMAELAEEWRNTYDYIILDMPPLAEVYDAGVVSKIVNGYVLTVRVKHSNISDVKVAAGRIKSVGGEVLGVIVNGINPKSGKKYKSYYSSYGNNSNV